MKKLLQAELESRAKEGVMVRVTLRVLKQSLAALGYRLDRRLAATCLARYMNGPRAGSSYPCMTLGIVESDTGRNFAHVDARRDANFKALQAMRLSSYAVAGGYIVEL